MARRVGSEIPVDETLGYDVQGNMTNRGVDTHAYDSANRMVSTTGKHSYAYDGHGHRVLSRRSSDHAAKCQVYDRSGRLMYEDDGWEGKTRKYIYLGDRLVSEVERKGSTTTTTYHHTDHIGTARLQTSTSRGTVATVVVAPYGSTMDGIYRDGPGFAGHQTDGATGLSYMKARYYDPVAMRFVSVDPVDVDAGTGANFNRYWYANNNPFSFVDPTGRLPDWFAHMIGQPGDSVGASREMNHQVGQVARETIAPVAEAFGAAEASRAEFQSLNTHQNRQIVLNSGAAYFGAASLIPTPASAGLAYVGIGLGALALLDKELTGGGIDAVDGAIFGITSFPFGRLLHGELRVIAPPIEFSRGTAGVLSSVAGAASAAGSPKPPQADAQGGETRGKVFRINGRLDSERLRKSADK